MTPQQKHIAAWRRDLANARSQLAFLERVGAEDPRNAFEGAHTGRTPPVAGPGQSPHR